MFDMDGLDRMAAVGISFNEEFAFGLDMHRIGYYISQEDMSRPSERPWRISVDEVVTSGA